MTADRARVSYDPTRQYRSVISQQGRVTLEADNNEAAAIADEALRLETIDVVGVTGTPDNGYAPGSGSGPGGVSIGPGIFYLGGWRLQLDKKIDLSSQPDWLDQPATKITTGNLLVALLLNEQSVCAVEDQALREVALGGPDSAARARLMQHFLRLPLHGKTCVAGATMLTDLLTADGVTIDPATLQLMSQARLQAGFVPGPPAADPCTPAAAGGYLGADNQLIRVTVIDYKAAAQTGTLLWGWNNASTLYRAGMTNPLTLTLTGAPVDFEHAPQLGQAVEILRSQAKLDDDGNYVAAPQGFVTTVAQAYSFDFGTVGLTDPLPPEYQSDSNPLFIRLWQAIVPFTAGQTTALDSASGITVTITLPALPAHIALRPFWRFAVRPSTPVQIYPQRYLDAPQPPDGPRQWIADIAVMAAGRREGSTLVQDCRFSFVPLTQQHGGECCNRTMGPDEVAARGGLQAVLDGLAGTKSGLSLLPGTYPLAAPLVLDKKHAGLTLESCGRHAILHATAKNLTPFAVGLIELTGAADIKLRGLTLQMPVIPINAAGTSVHFNIGMFASAAPNLTVEECTFQATVPAFALIGWGLAISGQTAGLAVRRNRFVGGNFAAGSSVFGVLASASNNTVTTSLDRADISDNAFEQLDAGVVTFSQLGWLRCANNRVTDCRTGLFFADSNLGAAGQAAQQGLAASAQSAQNAGLSFALNSGMQAPMLAATAGNMAQIVASSSQPPSAPAVSETAHRVLLQDITARGTDAWTTLAQPADAPSAVEAAPAPSSAISGTANAAAAAATPPITQELSDAIGKSLDMVQEIAIAAEVAGGEKVPVLHISGNDVTLTSTDVASGKALATLPGIGISVVFSPRDQAATVLLTANRVLTGDIHTTAAAILWPATAAVTGNIFMQPRRDTPVRAFVLNANRGADIEVMANVIVSGAQILPARPTVPPTASWNFFNTVG